MSLVELCRVKVWVWVGEGTGGVSALFCFQSQGRKPVGRLLTAHFFHPSVFCKATRASTDPLPSLGVKVGDRVGDVQLGCWELGRSHAMHSVVQSFIVYLLSVVLGLIFVFVLGIKDKQFWASSSS